MNYYIHVNYVIFHVFRILYSALAVNGSLKFYELNYEMLQIKNRFLIISLQVTQDKSNRKIQITVTNVI